MATRQQNWSKSALDCVNAAAKQGEAYVGKYRTLCMKGAGLVRQSGVVQAIVFLKARGGDEGKAFADDLAKVYGLKPGELLSKAQVAALPEYMAMTNDLVNIAIWFRRFAQSELRDLGEGE